MTKTVLITGATGFLGGRLLNLLSKSGWSCVGVGRQAAMCEQLENAGFTMLRCDLSAPNARDEILAGLEQNPSFQNSASQISAVVHCAALSSPQGPYPAFQRANVDSTRALITIAQALNVPRFVHISTPSVYFRLEDQVNQRESDPLPERFINNYAASKRVAEQLVLKVPELSPIILRPRGIYGPGDQQLLPRMIETAQQRPLPLFRNGAAAIDLTYVDDVCAAIEAALNAPSGVGGEIVNVSSGEMLPVADIVTKAAQKAGVSVRWRKLPLKPALAAVGGYEALSNRLPILPAPKITKYMLGLFAFAQSLNLEKAQQHLNWQPTVKFAEGLERTFDSREGR